MKTSKIILPPSTAVWPGRPHKELKSCLLTELGFWRDGRVIGLVALENMGEGMSVCYPWRGEINSGFITGS